MKKKKKKEKHANYKFYLTKTLCKTIIKQSELASTYDKTKKY